ncbi:hypothetical protein GCM10020000_42450 [Streptomyces olivoverticillatus]
MVSSHISAATRGRVRIVTSAITAMCDRKPGAVQGEAPKATEPTKAAPIDSHHAPTGRNRVVRSGMPARATVTRPAMSGRRSSTASAISAVNPAMAACGSHRT